MNKQMLISKLESIATYLESGGQLRGCPTCWGSGRYPSNVTIETWTADSDEVVRGVMSGHDMCRSQRWHDRYHGLNPGCCASPEERESWLCACTCHTSGMLF